MHGDAVRGNIEKGPAAQRALARVVPTTVATASVTAHDMSDGSTKTNSARQTTQKHTSAVVGDFVNSATRLVVKRPPMLEMAPHVDAGTRDTAKLVDACTAAARARRSAAARPTSSTMGTSSNERVSGAGALLGAGVTTGVAPGSGVAGAPGGAGMGLSTLNVPSGDGRSCHVDVTAATVLIFP